MLTKGEVSEVEGSQPTPTIRIVVTNTPQNATPAIPWTPLSKAEVLEAGAAHPWRHLMSL